MIPRPPWCEQGALPLSYTCLGGAGEGRTLISGVKARPVSITAQPLVPLLFCVSCIHCGAPEKPFYIVHTYSPGNTAGWFHEDCKHDDAFYDTSNTKEY
jgi:hypothetical protein